MSEELPKNLRLVMLFIDRVGFPAMAFLLMAYMSFVTLNRVTAALNENTKVLAVVANQLQEHRSWEKQVASEMHRR